MIKLWSSDDVPVAYSDEVRHLNKHVADNADYYAVIPGAAIAEWRGGKPVFNNSWRATANIFASFKRMGEMAWFGLAGGDVLLAGRLW